MVVRITELMAVSVMVTVMVGVLYDSDADKESDDDSDDEEEVIDGIFMHVMMTGIFKMADEVERRHSRRTCRAADETHRRAVYIDANEAFNKRSGIYVNTIEDNPTDQSVTMETGDNESTPLLNDGRKLEKQEKHLKKQIYDQVSRVEGTTRDLLQHGDNLSNAAAENFKKVKRRKKSKWRDCLCCCQDNSSED